MSRTRWVLVGTLLALVAVVLAPRSKAEGPFVPASPEEVVEQVPAGGEARKARAAARVALANKPDDVESAVKLARGYLDSARVEGNDVRLIGRAQAALAPWWNVLDAPPAVRLLRATLKQSLHDFAGSRADLDALVAANPADIQAWITRATVAQVVGDYPEAEKSCAALNGKVDPLIEVVCRAPLRGLRGEAAAAASAIDAALKAGHPPKLESWALSVSGELRWWAGELPAAERLFADTLGLDPHDDYTRGAWADLLLDANRPGEVVKLLEGRQSNDALLLRLCLAQRAAKGQAPACETLRERVAATRQRGDTVHRREEARFALQVEEDIPKALALAEANFQVQREPADVRVLLEAALAARNPAAAAPALEWMKRTGFGWAPVRELVKQLEAAR
jgi:hypothetical protein